ncbi:hypothetical protein EYF80_025312 [Liparis tanakae]|uniref:Uncharacterized protein n=1 Tax=Liparis tanakae TaxID=230148 RepID=A0A4Z2HFU1_9TELE|nr:hypothetical protein EYF80_025312 [Liparis tanakae]
MRSITHRKEKAFWKSSGKDERRLRESTGSTPGLNTGELTTIAAGMKDAVCFIVSAESVAGLALTSPAILAAEVPLSPGMTIDADQGRPFRKAASKPPTGAPVPLKFEKPGSFNGPLSATTTGQ